MTFDRRSKRTSRTARLDVESLGERIAPAHLGLMGGGHVFLNLELLGKHHHHGHGILVTESPKFELNSFKLPGQNTPIIASNPVQLTQYQFTTTTNFSLNTLKLPVPIPKTPPITANPPVTFTTNITEPVSFTTNPPPDPSPTGGTSVPIVFSNPTPDPSPTGGTSVPVYFTANPPPDPSPIVFIPNPPTIPRLAV